MSADHLMFRSAGYPGNPAQKNPLQSMQDLVEVYTPMEKDRSNPIAYPLQASSDELAGLPPTIIHVGELDTFIDEGRQMADKLHRAGGHVELMIGKGLVHCAAWIDLAPITPIIVKLLEFANFLVKRRDVREREVHSAGGK